MIQVIRLSWTIFIEACGRHPVSATRWRGCVEAELWPEMTLLNRLQLEGANPLAPRDIRCQDLHQWAEFEPVLC